MAQQQELASQQVINQLTMEKTESANLEVSCVPARSSPAWRGRSRPTRPGRPTNREHHSFRIIPSDPQTQIAALKAQQYTPKNPAAKCVDEEGACLKCYEDAAKSGKVRAYWSRGRMPAGWRWGGVGLLLGLRLRLRLRLRRNCLRLTNTPGPLEHPGGRGLPRVQGGRGGLQLMCKGEHGHSVMSPPCTKGQSTQ